MADFVTRHVGTWGADQQAMLELVGVASTEELIRRAMPPSIVSEVAGAKLPEALGEAIFLLADLWLNPQTRPTTPARQRARCSVFQQMTQALGLDLLTDEQAEELAALCEAE